MKKWIVVTIICCLLSLGSAGCLEEMLAGVGIGAVGMSALDATEKSLVEQGENLNEQREIALQEVKDANTPEELSLAEKKLAVLDNSIIANRAALQTVKSIKAVSTAETPQKRTDAILVGVMGIAGIAIREWQKRTLNKKYIAMKSGKARLETDNPEAASKLHSLIGEERRRIGL